MVVFVSFSWVTCYLSCLISRDIWRGIFAASSGRLCYGFINPGCFSSQYLLVFCFNVAHCRAISFLCTGRILLGDYFFWLALLFLFLVMFVDLFYFFCFSCSGWGIGPCGGVVEPDLRQR